jgi:hypothetical protein
MSAGPRHTLTASTLPGLVQNLNPYLVTVLAVSGTSSPWDPRVRGDCFRDGIGNMSTSSRSNRLSGSFNLCFAAPVDLLGRVRSDRRVCLHLGLPMKPNPSRFVNRPQGIVKISVNRKGKSRASPSIAFQVRRYFRWVRLDPPEILVFGLVRRIPVATDLVTLAAHGPYRGGLLCGEPSQVYSMRLHQVPNSHSCDFDEQPGSSKRRDKLATNRVEAWSFGNSTVQAPCHSSPLAPIILSPVQSHRLATSATKLKSPTIIDHRPQPCSRCSQTSPLGM